MKIKDGEIDENISYSYSDKNNIFGDIKLLS